jgi:hypothetical protein
MLFGYWQLIASVWAVLVAIVFGRYAVEQVKLSRVSYEEAKSAEVRRILMALFMELVHNRSVALYLEGRLVVDFRLHDTFQFRWKVWDNLLAGPIWGLPLDLEQVYQPVSKAYWQTRLLSAMLQPRVSPANLAIPAGILGVQEALATSGPITERFRLVWKFLGVAILGYVLLDVCQKWDLRRKGLVRQTREAIESALEQLHRILFRRPIDWTKLDKIGNYLDGETGEVG